MTLKMASMKKKTKLALDRKHDDHQQRQTTEKKAKSGKQKKLGIKSKRGVMLLSHIPNGFYEPQMFDFFRQFGEVTRLKLARSRKTGKTRHFAFIEFQFEEVAQIAADTMNNYLMFQKILKCKLIPNEQLKPGTFKNWQYKQQLPKTQQQAIRRHNADLVDPVKIERKNKKLKMRREGLQKKLNEMGIDYDVINIKVNESFVPPARSRATPEGVEKLNAKVLETDERCSDFEYSDDGMDESREKKEDATPDVANSEQGTQVLAEKAEDDDLGDANTTNISVKEQEENEFAVMVVDADDPEVTFKSPPASAKIKRRSIADGSAARFSDDRGRVANEGTPGKRKTPRVLSRQKRLQKLKELQKELGETEKDGEELSTPKGKNPKKSPRTERKTVKKRTKLNKTV